MKFKTLMVIKAVVCLVLGAFILVLPKFFYGLFGITLAGAGIFPAWEYGASLIGNFLLTWFARYARESKGRRAIIKGMTVYNALGFVATLIAAISGWGNALLWFPVALYLFFAVGFGYFWVKPPVP
jgi:hypothetical protein